MRYLFFSVLFLTAGCVALPRPEGFVFQEIQTETFAVAAWTRVKQQPVKVLRIYIEGDGFAWQTPTRPSSDPTPRRSLPLAWAQKDKGDVVYLARPCQYVFSSRCSAYFWTDGRFAPEIIDSMDDALKTLLEKYKPEKVELIGYSGGAAVAVLLAAKHSDRVGALITVAGVLDHRQWTAYHGDSPLEGSLNPADEQSKIRRIPQKHYVGGKDEIVPQSLARQWVSDQRQVIVVPAASHGEGWPESF